MNFARLQPRERRLAAAALAATLLFFTDLAVRPVWKACRDRARSLDRLRGEVILRRRAEERLPSLRREWAGLASRPDAGEGRESWMKRFEALAAATGVELLQRGASAAGEKERTDATRVECSMRGSFESVVRFLDALDRDGSRPRIESCHLASTKPGEDRIQGRLALSVALNGGANP